MNQPLISEDKFIQIQQYDEDIRFDLQISLDDPQYYQLPNQINCDFKGHHKRINIDAQIIDIPNELHVAAKDIVKYYGNLLTVWDIRQNQHYSFKFPPSAFKGQIQIIEQQHQEIKNEYNQVRDLQAQQISQIFQTGTFEIESRQFPIPYVWQLSQWIIKGRSNINTSYSNDLANSYYNYKIIYHRLYSKRDSEQFSMTLRSGLYYLLTTPFLYVSILIGFREMFNPISKDKIYNILEAQRQKQLQKLEYLDKSIYEFLNYTDHVHQNAAITHYKYEQLTTQAKAFNNVQEITLQMQNQYDLMNTKNELYGVEIEDNEQQEYVQNLKEEMTKQAINFIKEYNIQVNATGDINEQIQQALYDIQRQQWQKNSAYSAEISTHLWKLAECHRVYNYHYEVYKSESSRLRNQLQEQMKIKHSIRSQCKEFVKQYFAEQFTPQRRKLKQEMLAQVEQELMSQGIQEGSLIKNYILYKKSCKAQFQFEMDKQVALHRIPQITVNSTRQCFPPYKVLECNHYYSLERDKTYSITSRFPGWKIGLFGIRWFTWTANVMYWLFANAFSGPLGLRALFGISKFHPDVQINPETGVVSPTSYSVTTVIGHLRSVYEGMQNSRQQFESAPDTGFFGKKCARLCNLIEVYIFRWLFVGIICVLILLPIIILLNVTISLALAITSWAWIPIVLLITYLFELLFYDFDVNSRRSNSDSLWYSPCSLPIFMVTYKLLVYGIFQTLLSILLIFVIHPFCIVFMFIFAQIRYALRSLYDCFMILIVKWIGRVPASENSLAWKISGPGVSRQYYFALSNESFLLLIGVQLEKCMLQEYKQRQSKLIQQPKDILNQQISKFFGVFQAHYSFNDQGCQILETLLERQYNDRLRMLPSYESHKCRFTANELALILNQSKQFIKKQIELKNMSSYIWTYYQTRKGDYNALVREIVQRTFGSQVFEPFEDVEMRFQLNKEENYQYKNKVQRALQGQVNLEIPQGYSVLPKQIQEAAIFRHSVPYLDV